MGVRNMVPSGVTAAVVVVVAEAVALAGWTGGMCDVCDAVAGCCCGGCNTGGGCAYTLAGAWRVGGNGGNGGTVPTAAIVGLMCGGMHGCRWHTYVGAQVRHTRVICMLQVLGRSDRTPGAVRRAWASLRSRLMDVIDDDDARSDASPVDDAVRNMVVCVEEVRTTRDTVLDDAGVDFSTIKSIGYGAYASVFSMTAVLPGTSEPRDVCLKALSIVTADTRNRIDKLLADANVGPEYNIEDIANVRLTPRTNARADDFMTISADVWPIEVAALRRLNDADDAAVARGGRRTVPRLIPVLTNADALLIGMDLGVCQLQDLPEWLDTARGVRERVCLDELDIEHIAYAMFECLDVAHRVCGLIHTDVCPRNFVVFRCADDANALEVRLADWGCSYDTRATHADLAAGYYTSRWYRAPELILRPEAPPTPAIDVWSVGLALLQVLAQSRGLPVCPLGPGVGLHSTDDARRGALDVITAIFNMLGVPHERSWAREAVAAYMDCTVEQLEGAMDANDAQRTRTANTSHTLSARAFLGRLHVPHNVPVPRGIQALLYDVLQWDPAFRPTACDVLKCERYWTNRYTVSTHRVRVQRTAVTGVI